jgi:hypothetical protein
MRDSIRRMDDMVVLTANVAGPSLRCTRRGLARCTLAQGFDFLGDRICVGAEATAARW